MKKTAFDIVIFAVMTAGGLFISQFLFIFIGGSAVLAVFSAYGATAFAAFFIETFSGLPIGILSLPMALTAVTVELTRQNLNERSTAALLFLFLISLTSVSILHLAAMIIL